MTLYGHDVQTAALRAAVAGARMHHAWLLAGPRGVGKARFAALAAALLLDAEAPDSAAAKLIAAGSHPDFLRLERLVNDKTDKLARSIIVDQVRALRERLQTGTSIADRRVIVIDAVDDLEGKAGPNALLKSLEEPPANTIFLLVSHQPGRLLPTIRSRCRTLTFGPLGDADMTTFLSTRLPEMAADTRAALVASAGGAPATALAYAELDVAALDATLGELARGGDPTNAVRSKLAQSLALKAALPRYDAFLQRAPSFIAQVARGAQGAALERALAAWGRARDLAQIAIPHSLVAETVVFEMAGIVASLAPEARAAKA